MSVDWGTKVVQPLVGVFGGPALYYPRDGGQAFAVRGVFDASYREVVIVDSLSYTSDEQPVFGIDAAQFAARRFTPGQNDKIKILDPLVKEYGQTFIVKEVRPDSHGHIRLVMNLAAAQL